MDMTERRINFIVNSILAIALIISISAFIAFVWNWSEEQNNKPLIIETINTTLLDSIHDEIINLELEHPDIVFSQALLESAYATSDLFISNNNLFGMKESGSRATVSDSIVNGYKWYHNWRESLIDYALFQMAFYRGLNETEYYRKLSSSYAQDSRYVQKLKSIDYIKQ